MVGINSLQLGQTVSVTSLEFGYEIHVVSGDQPGLKVLEIGKNHILLDDAEAGIRTRLPAHMIKSVKTTAPEVPQAA